MASIRLIIQQELTNKQNGRLLGCCENQSVGPDTVLSHIGGIWRTEWCFWSYVANTQGEGGDREARETGLGYQTVQHVH